MCVLSGCGNNARLPEDFSLSNTSVVFKVVGETTTVYNGEIEASQISWTSADPMVAEVENGTVTAKGIGKTEVYAEYFGAKYTCKVDCSTLQYTPQIFGDTQNVTDSDSEGAVLALPNSFDGPSAYFNDAAFIGDSVSLKLSYYAEETGELGDALFLVSGNYGVAHAVNDTMQLFYQGQDTSPQDALAASGVNKVFIMLGMNDIGLYGVDDTIENWKVFISNIRSKNPHIAICIQSMTPVWTGGEVGDLNNSAVDEYNEKLKNLALENGCAYMDIASYMKDSSGGLATQYCSDSFVHLTDAGAAAWVDVLKAYAGC